MRIAVLMTCHDRRETTRRSLARLRAALAAADGVEAEVFLVDDGSTDGTGEMVRREFPEVRVVEGDGTLYWSRGMRRAWDAANGERDDWDGYLWLNDDVMLLDDALARISAAAEARPDEVAVGALRDEATGERIYGAGGEGLFTGCCVLVPRTVFEKAGTISDAFRHAWGDYDYAERCRRLGVGWREVEGEVGEARTHPMRPDLKGMSLADRWRSLFDPKGWCLADVWTYRRRNGGLLRAAASAVHVLFHVLFAAE